MTKPVDIKTIVDELTARIDSLCRQFFPADTIDGRYCIPLCPWRSDRKPGSFVIYLSGARRGRWTDYATGEFGDALDLVAQTKFHGDKSEAVRWSLRWLGGAIQETPRQSAPARDRAAESDELEKFRKCAKAIWLAGREDLTDTPVDRYLAGRGVDLRRLARPPRAIRFHPDLWHRESKRYWPAMVAAICDASGKFLSVHRTWLERQRDGTVRKAPLERNKMCWPDYHGGFIRLARGASGKPIAQAPEGEDLWVSEGNEDGLTAAQAAHEHRIIAAVTITNIANLPLERFKRLHLLLQNDTNPKTLRQRATAIAGLQRKGHEVWLHKPPATFHDINELQQAVMRGEAGVA